MVVLIITKVIKPTKEKGKYKIQNQEFILCKSINDAHLYLNDSLKWGCYIYQYRNTDILIRYHYNKWDKHFDFACVMEVNNMCCYVPLKFEFNQDLFKIINEQTDRIYGNFSDYKEIDYNYRYHVELPNNYEIVENGVITDETLVIDDDNAKKGFYKWYKAVEHYYFQVIDKNKIKEYTIEEALKKLHRYKFANPINR